MIFLDKEAIIAAFFQNAFIEYGVCVCACVCACIYYQLSHGCQGDTEKYLTRGNLYHPRHTCITRDVVEGNTGVSRVIQVFHISAKYRFFISAK